MIPENRLANDAVSTESNSVQTCYAVGAFWVLFGAVVSRGLTLGASVVAGRLLGTTGFGEVGMIQSTQGLFGVLAGAGLGLAATKYVAEYRAVDWSRAGRCVSLATLIAVVTGLAASVLFLAFSGAIATRIIEALYLVRELQVATALVLFGAINGVQTGAIVGVGNFRTVAVLQIVRGICQCVLLVVGIALAGVMGGVIGLVLTEVIAVLANQWALGRVFPQLWPGFYSRSHTPVWERTGVPKQEFGNEVKVWKELATIWRFSLLALLSSLATMPAMWFGNRLLAVQPGGYSALGIFFAADRWRQLLLFLPASLSPLILSMLSNLHGKNDAGGYRRLFGINLSLTTGTILAPGVVIALFAPLAMTVFGAEYEGGGTTLIILTASTLAVGFNNFLGQVLVSRGAIWWRFIMDVLLGAVMALVAWQMIPVYQEKGLALANLVAYSVTAVALIVPAAYYLKLPKGMVEEHAHEDVGMAPEPCAAQSIA